MTILRIPCPARELPTVLTLLATDFAPRPDLEYPFKLGFSPDHGQPFEVANGVYWLRMPLPYSLDHINLWLLRDGDGWVIVDSGFDDPSSKQVWNRVFAEFCSPAEVRKIIITHYHPDHIGLASWLAHKCDCKVHITRGEFERYRLLVDRAGQAVPPEIRQFSHEVGFNERQQKVYRQFFAVDEKPDEARLQFADCEFIQNGEEIEIGEHIWRVVMGNGHSPEHACLYCPQIQTLISGDQVLPRISSNISVHFNNRDANPLADWLASCARLRDQIPHKTLVLPAHQEPFYGLKLRMQQLIDDHHAQLNKLRSRIKAPITAAKAHKILFDRELGDIDILLATSETLAHLNYLLHRDELTSQQVADGTVEYSLKQASTVA